MRWRDRFARQPAEMPVSERMATALEAARRGDHATALAIWEPLAHAGVARAQNNIGACFAEGLGVERDPGLAFRWLTLAAEGNDPVGQRNLASLYFRGEGVEQDYRRAAELYRRAAEQGDAPAQDMLSWMLLEGEVVDPDVAEARRWATAAADQGIASAMTRLGMLYHNALGVPRDPAEAVRWWRRAAAAWRCGRPGDAGRRLPSRRRRAGGRGRGVGLVAARPSGRQQPCEPVHGSGACCPEHRGNRRGRTPRQQNRCRRSRHDRGHGGTCRPRQDGAGACAHRRRHRPSAGRKSARHDDRSRLRLSADTGRRHHRLRRRSGPRALRSHHARRRQRHRFRAAGRGRGRRRHAADAGAPRHRRSARHQARRSRALKIRPCRHSTTRCRCGGDTSHARRNRARRSRIDPRLGRHGRRHRCSEESLVRGGVTLCRSRGFGPLQIGGGPLVHAARRRHRRDRHRAVGRGRASATTSW